MALLRRILLALVCGLAFLVGLTTFAGAALAQGGRWNPWLDVLAHFAVIWLAGAALCSVIGLLVARGTVRRVLLVLGLLGIAASAMLMAREFTRPIRPAVPAVSGRSLRLIQFNAWGELRDPAAAADWIAGQKPDLVAIEELTPALRLQLARRGYAGGRDMLGTVVLYRGLRPLPPFRVPPADWPHLPAFARARFAAPGGVGDFTVVAVHLNWPIKADHWRQTETFADMLDGLPRDRLIIAGDFNLTPWSFTLRRLDTRLGLERRDRAILTWPARRGVRGVVAPLLPVLPIDHVYAGPAWRTVAVRRGPRLGSDHYPVVVDLTLP